jgi:hypothetical protein
MIWSDEIKNALSRARIAIFLVSNDFLASDFVMDEELPVIVGAADKKLLKLIWIPIRPSNYKFFEDIVKRQAVISPDQPLSSLSPADQDRALVKICEEIDHAFNQ